MRQLLFLFVLLAVLPGCSKENNEPGFNLVDLVVVSTDTPGQVLPGQNISITGTWAGSDLCYHFSHFDIKEAAPRTYDIRAKATYPSGKNGDIVCLEAVYYFDTTITLNTTTSGQYLLRYFNGSLLSKTDTMQVQ